MATSTKELLKQLHKDHGAAIATVGSKGYADVPRIPTGIFAVDLAMGGGFPQGKCAIIYGPESSLKTVLALKAAAQAQRMYPDKKVVFVDAEHALDVKWAMTLGVDPDSLIVVHPESAEQAVDVLESFYYAEDVSLIILDSIAALTTSKEIENDASVQAVGGASLLVGKLFRKVVVAAQKMNNQGLTPPTFISINQIRSKIGVQYGNPETMPGGFPPKFASSMTLRVYGKNIIDKKISTAMPSYKEVSCIIQKWKCPILAVNAVYQMQMIEGLGQKPGYIADWNTVSKFAKQLDYLSKGEKAGWVMLGKPYKTLDECRDALYGNPDMLAELKATLIAELVVGGVAMEDTGEIAVDDGK